MRRLAVLASFAVAVGALVARRRRRRAREDAAPLEAPASSPPLAPPPAPAEPAARFVSVPWTLAAAPDDRPELSVRYGADRFMELDRVDVQETPTQVFVTVLVRWQPPAGGWFADREEREATAALSAPLGDRELVHAAVDLRDGEPSGPPL